MNVHAPSPHVTQRAGVSISALAANSCRFPLWEHADHPGPADALYCGDAAVAGGVYCDCHYAITGGRPLGASGPKFGALARYVAKQESARAAIISSPGDSGSQRSFPVWRPGRTGGSLALPVRSEDVGAPRSAAEQRAHYSAVRERLLGAAPRMDCASTPGPRQPPPSSAADDVNWWEEIVGVVCDRYGIQPSALIGESRDSYIVRARQVTMYLADVLTENSLSVIGRALGRDATTVHHGARKVAALISVNPLLAAEVEALRLKLTGGDAA